MLFLVFYNRQMGPGIRIHIWWRERRYYTGVGNLGNLPPSHPSPSPLGFQLVVPWAKSSSSA